MRTEQIVNQLVLAAAWDFSEERIDPVDAAVAMIGVSPSDPRLARLRAVVEAAADLTWEERVGVAAHTLLQAEGHDLPMAA